MSKYYLNLIACLIEIESEIKSNITSVHNFISRSRNDSNFQISTTTKLGPIFKHASFFHWMIFKKTQKKEATYQNSFLLFLSFVLFLHSHHEWEGIGFMWKMTFVNFIKSLSFETPWVRKNGFYESVCLSVVGRVRHNEISVVLQNRFLK